MSASEKTKNIIWGQFAGRCAICREKVIYKNKYNEQSLIGEVAHIVGEKEKSARFTNSISIEQRNHHDNLMLLCTKHHTIIDKAENIKEYPIEILNEIKKNFLYWIDSNLVEIKPLKIKIHHHFYINIPRLYELAINYNERLYLGDYEKGIPLHAQSFEFLNVMVSARKLLNLIQVKSIKFNNINYIHKSYIGALVYIEQERFRTKNIFKRDEANTKVTGNIENDAHIYHMHKNNWKLVLHINPDWIPTSTGLSSFCPEGGTTYFSSIFTVKNIDIENKIMYGSPIIIGIPPGPSEEEN